MNDFIYSYLGSIFFIIIGVCILFFIVKNPTKYNKMDTQGGDLKGWAGGIGFILIGIYVIVQNILGNW
jgi:hypothetical protein